MLQNKKQLTIRAGMVLALIFLFLGNGAFAQSKYDLQVTGGYSVSDSWDMNGYNFDISVNRNIWSVISIGAYLDYDNVDNLIPEVNGNGSNYSGNFIPFTLDSYIKSLSQGEAMFFSQDQANFLSYGIKTNFDFKIFRKFKIGFYVGIGLTTRKWASLFLISSDTDANGNITAYTLGTIFLKTTEFSWRYGFKFTYNISKRINVILQIGHNASDFNKYSTGFTTYTKANLGVAIKL